MRYWMSLHPIRTLIPCLLENYNRITGEWDNLTVPDVNRYPHAPWWEHKAVKPYIPRNRAELLDHYEPNTNAVLAGMLVKYASLVPQDIVAEVTGIVMDKVRVDQLLSPYDRMSLLYFVGALQDETLKRDPLKTLMGDGRLVSILDGDWRTENAFKLCLWIDSPEHPYYPLYQEDVQKNLEFLLYSQDEDGSWASSWCWGEPAVWARVSKRSKGLLNVKLLWTLHTFGLITKSAV